jgi:hypothetical protein
LNAHDGFQKMMRYGIRRRDVLLSSRSGHKKTLAADQGFFPGPDSLGSAFRAAKMTNRLRLSAGKPRWQWQACRCSWGKYGGEMKDAFDCAAADGSSGQGALFALKQHLLC